MNIRFIAAGIFIVFHLLAPPASAQKSRMGNWLMYFGNNKIHNRWNWWNELQYRSFNYGSDPDQLLLRTGFGYNLSQDNDNILLGYAFVYGQPYLANGERVETREHRLFQQYLTRQVFSHVYLQHRYRVEQRWVESDFSLRMRYFLSLIVTLNHKLLQKNTVYLSAYNEVFIQFRNPIFDRNRIYGAIGYSFSPSLRLETGIMYHIFERRPARPQWQVAFFNSIPISNKKQKQNRTNGNKGS